MLRVTFKTFNNKPLESTGFLASRYCDRVMTPFKDAALAVSAVSFVIFILFSTLSGNKPTISPSLKNSSESLTGKWYAISPWCVCMVFPMTKHPTSRLLVLIWLATMVLAWITSVREENMLIHNYKSISKHILDVRISSFRYPQIWFINDNLLSKKLKSYFNNKLAIITGDIYQKKIILLGGIKINLIKKHIQKYLHHHVSHILRIQMENLIHLKKKIKIIFSKYITKYKILTISCRYKK